MIASPTGRRFAALVLTVAPWLLACEQPELRYETEHLRIGTDFDEPLCRGDLDRMELVITVAESLLATSVEERVDVYLWSVEDWPGANVVCRAGTGGCYLRSGPTIYANQALIDHELIHAVTATLGRPATIWDEGAAEALQSQRKRYATSRITDNLELEAPELDYNAAGSFVRWLLETRGPEQLRELLETGGDPRESFEHVYGMTVEQAEDQYFVEAPYSYGALIACEHPDLAARGESPRAASLGLSAEGGVAETCSTPGTTAFRLLALDENPGARRHVDFHHGLLAEVDELRWAETLDVDCAEPHVFGGPGAMGSYRVLTIAERGHYSLSSSAASIRIARCQDEDLEQAPLPDDADAGDVPLADDTWPDGYARVLPGDGELTVLDLAPGRYEIAAVFPDHEPRTASLEVRAALGPVPVLP